jgi:hypothetical protein
MRFLVDMMKNRISYNFVEDSISKLTVHSMMRYEFDDLKLSSLHPNLDVWHKQLYPPNLMCSQRFVGLYLYNL